MIIVTSHTLALLIIIIIIFYYLLDYLTTFLVHLHCDFVPMLERETKQCLMMSWALRSHDAGVLLQGLFEQ